MRKTVSVLGATGSVGESTLKLIAAMPDAFEITLLSAHRNRARLAEQARQHRPKFVAICGEADAALLREELAETGVEVLCGQQELLQALTDYPSQIVVSAIVGAAGLKPTMAAIRAGSDIGLANKESMVVAGAFMQAAAAEAKVAILPIDSEHNALHQCLRGERVEEVKRLILTASGGPFRTYTGNFEEITPAQALKHPTWDMGPKISIDSATMMNKGLEVIEAHYLFGFPGKAIDIVVHPQSIVHSMIETVDGSYLCQLGKTDMCDPIQYALTYPARKTHPFAGLDITQGATLEFFPCDRQRFPCIQLAYDALEGGPTAPTVLNAANEMAVAAFLEGQIRFTDIPKINRFCMEAMAHTQASSLDDLLALDGEVRHKAKTAVTKVAHASQATP